MKFHGKAICSALRSYRVAFGGELGEHERISSTCYALIMSKESLLGMGLNANECE